jgi:RNA-binding protein
MPATTPPLLSTRERQHLKTLGHTLSPVVTVAGKGLSETVSSEIKRALHDHELIKVKFAVGDRDVKRALIAELCQLCQCALVQQIGHLALIYKPNPDARPGLSNLQRHR